MEARITATENDGREWYTIDGREQGTGRVFDEDMYARTADGTILDCDGCPLTVGGNEWIVVTNVIETAVTPQDDSQDGAPQMSAVDIISAVCDAGADSKQALLDALQDGEVLAGLGGGIDVIEHAHAMVTDSDIDAHLENGGTVGNYQW